MAAWGTNEDGRAGAPSVVISAVLDVPALGFPIVRLEPLGDTSGRIG